MSDGDRIATLVATAYDTETFRPTLAEVRRRARGRLRRRLPAFLAALVALLLAGGVLTVEIAADRAFTALCTSAWHKAHPGPLPPLLLSVGGEPGLRVYGTRGRVAMSCIRDEHGHERDSDTLGFAPFGMVMGALVYRSDRPWRFVVGNAPPGTTRVDLRLDDGSVRRATLGHSWWAAMVPADQTDQMWVSAVGRHRVFVGTASGLPTSLGLGGPVDPDTDPYHICDAAASVYLRAPDVDTGQRLRPLITKTGPGQYENTSHGLMGPSTLFVYGSSTAFLPCGSMGAGFAVFGRDPATPLTAYVMEDDGWAVMGQTPLDTVSVTVQLSDGSSVAATVNDGAYAAWSFDETDLPPNAVQMIVAVIARTPSGTYRVVPPR